MLKNLVQIACSALIVSSLYSKEIPMVREIEVSVPVGEFSVIEFPFKIKSYAFTPFKYRKKLNEISKPAVHVVYSKPTLNKKNAISKAVKKRLKIEAIKKTKPFSVQKGVNVFRFYPVKTGKTELLVWGYKKYPMMIKINVIKNIEEADTLIKFIDPQENTTNAENFESAPHDKVVIKITKALYNYTLPKGYKEKTTVKEYISKQLQVSLIRSIVGRRYMGEEYKITNISDKTIRLNTEMFENNGIYGVTFLNNIVTPSHSTRLFIVRENRR